MENLLIQNNSCTSQKPFDDVSISRYITMEKFICFLTNGLYVPRAGVFADNYEGRIPYPKSVHTDEIIYSLMNCNEILEDLKKDKNSNSTATIIYQALTNASKSSNLPIIHPYSNTVEFFKLITNINGLKKEDKYTEITNILQKIFFDLYVNRFYNALVTCWYAANKEDMPMWNIYTDKNGVAIQTKVNKVSQLFYDNGLFCYNGYVNYPDDYEEIYSRWQEDEFYTTNIKNFLKNTDISYPEYWFFYKRPRYRYENEYRFLSMTTSNILGYNSTTYQIVKNGIYLKIHSFDDFVEKIILRPNASQQHLHTIKELVSKFYISPNKVVKSEFS